MKGHIRKRGQKSWAIVLDLGRDANGKRQQRWHSVKGNKKDAEKEMARLIHEIETGAYVEPNKMSVADYLQHWLDAYAKVSVAPKTYERYEEIVRNHLAPGIGSFALPKLKPLHIQSYYSHALQNGRLSGKGGLSAQTILHHHRLLRTALQQAVKWQLIIRNPADAVEPPRPVRKKVCALDENDTGKLLKAIEGTRLYGPVLTALCTGMRRGEILALKWDDVDFGSDQLTVCASLEETREGLRFKTPKTAKGRRVISMPKLLADYMRSRKSSIAEEKLLLGPAYQDYGIVFAQPNGLPWTPSSLSSSFLSMVDRKGFGSLRLHDLRHTHASQLLKQGIHPKVVSERLGHSTISITLDTYSHLLPGLQEEAAHKIDALLRIGIEGSDHQN